MTAYRTWQEALEDCNVIDDWLRERESWPEWAWPHLTDSMVNAEVALPFRIVYGVLVDRSGETFTADDLYARVRHLTSSPNALGALIGAAARRGEIVAVGVDTSKRPSRHSGLQRIWHGTGGGVS